MSDEYILTRINTLTSRVAFLEQTLATVILANGLAPQSAISKLTIEGPCSARTVQRGEN